MKRFFLAASLLLFGAGCVPARPASPPQSPASAPVPPGGPGLAPAVAYGEAMTLADGESRVFTDGLQVTLTDINDSRCKPGVQCVWAGELSYTFDIQYPDQPPGDERLTLGMLTKKEGRALGKTFTLVSGDERSVTISAR